MTDARPPAAPPIPPLPGWIETAPAESLATAVFRSGAALGTLHLVVRQKAIPQGVWRDRLAVMAAERCAQHAGRREGGRELRDALHLLRPGDRPGPGGLILRQWSRAVARPLPGSGLEGMIADLPADRLARGLAAASGGPVERAAGLLAALLAEGPRAEAPALILADAVLARALGWSHLLPCLGLALTARDLRLRGEALQLACHRAVVAGAGRAVPLAADLARRAERLAAVAPKLRAKGAGRAVEMFLARDALAPAALDFMSDRAARRLCDRLVELGALRELTGRDTFRLYGL